MRLAPPDRHKTRTHNNGGDSGFWDQRYRFALRDSHLRTLSLGVYVKNDRGLRNLAIGFFMKRLLELRGQDRPAEWSAPCPHGAPSIPAAPSLRGAP